jgi:hypothetical protein
VIIVESEPVKEAPTVEPARLIETASKTKGEAEPIGAWPLPFDLDQVPVG